MAIFAAGSEPALIASLSSQTLERASHPSAVGCESFLLCDPCVAIMPRQVRTIMRDDVHGEHGLLLEAGLQHLSMVPSPPFCGSRSDIPRDTDFGVVAGDQQALRAVGILVVAMLLSRAALRSRIIFERRADQSCRNGPRYPSEPAALGRSPELNSCAMVTSSALASFNKFSSDGFLNARSIPARYVRCMSAASASFSCESFRSRRSSRRRSASARFASEAETNRPSCDLVNYESIEYK